MPRARAFILDAMRSLAQQVAFVPRDAARRQLESVRTLVSTVRADDLSGWSDVEYKITKFRSEKRPEYVNLQVVGASLARDLNELALRLSARAPEAAADAYTTSQLARAWKVSERTLHRYRSLGLLFCWVQRTRMRAGSHTLVVGIRKSDAIAFRQLHARRIERAGAFSRMDDSTRRAILSRGASAAATGERRITSAARAIATTVGRSRESVRTLLKKHPSASDGKLAGRPSREPRAGALALSAFRQGSGAAQIARRLKCSRAAADRLVQQARGADLRRTAGGFLLKDVEIPSTFWRENAREVLLAPRSVRADLMGASPIVNGMRWLAMAPSTLTAAASAVASSARMMAVRYLLWSAQRAAGVLPVSRPPERTLDQIDTDLRWARLILRTLFSGAMPTVATRLKAWSGVDPMQFTAADSTRLLTLAAKTLLEVVLEADPIQIADQRIKLVRALALALDRRLISVALPARTSRAGAAAGAATAGGTAGAAMREPLDLVAPWLRPADTLARRVARLDQHADGVALWHQRLGWDGARPQTVQEIAHELKKPVGVVARMLSRAIARQSTE